MKKGDKVKLIEHSRWTMKVNLEKGKTYTVHKEEDKYCIQLKEDLYKYSLKKKNFKVMEEELTVKKERVKKAAQNYCGDAVDILKELFPEAFKETYKVGDIFKNRVGRHFKLTVIPRTNRVFLCGLDCSTNIGNPAIVEDLENITKEELNCMINESNYKYVGNVLNDVKIIENGKN